MKVRDFRAGAVLAIGLSLAGANARAVVISQELSGTDTSNPNVYWGETFTTAAGGPWDTISVNFYDPSGAPLAGGTGYIFNAPYTGAPSGLSGGGALAASTSTSGGYWHFATGLTLAPSTEYFFYEDAPLTLLGDANSVLDTYSFTFAAGTAFSPVVGSDINYTVTSGAIPEPESWVLMLAGIGGMGALLRGRRRQTV